MTSHPRPDPAHGLFETLLVLDGEPVELDAHLGRLAASLDELYGSEPPPDLAEAIRLEARGMALGRLRVSVTRDGAVTELAGEDVDPADHFPAPERGAKLRSLPCPEGLGAHKLADRRALGPTRGAVVPLLLEADGEVLEASRANVFVAVGGTLFTPRADGRILPGIARAGAIAAAAEIGVEVVEGRLDRERLLGADEAFLTGSVRGVEPAASLDGERLAGAGPLSRRVGDGLRRRWAHHPVGPLAEAAQSGVLRRLLGDDRLRIERRLAGALGDVGGAARLLGGIKRHLPHCDHGLFGRPGDRQRLVDPPLELAQQRRHGALGEQPVLGAVALGSLHWHLNLGLRQAAKPLQARPVAAQSRSAKERSSMPSASIAARTRGSQSVPTSTSRSCP
jgi:hypothetical protein